MKSLLVVPQPFFEVRGTPLNVRQMVRSLTAEGHEVHVATYPVGEPVDIDGLTVHRCVRVPGIRHVPIGFSKRKIVLDLLLTLTVVRLLLFHRFDVVHAIEESVFFSLPLALLRRVPLIYDLDSSLSDQLRYAGVLRSRTLLAAVRYAERLALRHATCALTVCRSLTEFVRELSPTTEVFQIEDAPMESVTRAPRQDVVERLRRDLDVEGRTLFVYTGNFEPYQGIDLLLQAVGILATKHARFAVILVGGTSQAVRRLRARAEAAGVAHHLRFTGRREPEELPEYLALADALLSPRTEGQNTPLKVFTYMFAERPIVATDLETHRQVLDSRTAVLVPPTPEQFADGMDRLLRAPAEADRLARAARRRVEERYSVAAFREKLSNVYDVVVGQRNVTMPERAEPVAPGPEASRQVGTHPASPTTTR